ncbi:unnamed protein product [Phaeothamnion confervicola]
MGLLEWQRGVHTTKTKMWILWFIAITIVLRQGVAQVVNNEGKQSENLSGVANAHSRRGIQASSSYYLVPTCAVNRFSNRLICLQRSLALAFLLERTWVLPVLTNLEGKLFVEEGDYDLARLFDVEAFRRCHGGPGVIATWSEFLLDLKGGTDEAIVLPEFSCIPCKFGVCVGINTYTKNLGIRFEGQVKYEDKSRSQKGPSYAYTAEFMNASFGRHTGKRVVVLSELFGTLPIDIPIDFRNDQPGGDAACGPSTHLRYRPEFITAARNFVRSFLGPKYMAVHWRRGDMVEYCDRATGGHSCVYDSLPRSAACIVQRAQRAETADIFLATDASAVEVAGFVRLLERRELNVVRLEADVMRRPNTTQPSWCHRVCSSEPQRAVDLDDELQVIALEKIIMIHATVFVGSTFSTFSKAVRTERADIGLDHEQDASAFCEPTPADVLVGPW